MSPLDPVSRLPRAKVLRVVCERLLALPDSRVQRIAIDGVDGAGKTHFADELATALRLSGRPVIRASVDGFHKPRAQRYARGRDSAEGFYFDSYDYDALRAALLDPLSPGGDGRYRTAIFEHASDSPVSQEPVPAPCNALLLLDGIFLHRPELRPYWDLSLFLQVDFKVSIPRGAQRGTGSPDPSDPSNQRYLGGQRLYLNSCEPARRATLVIDNNDLAMPRIVSVTRPL